MCRGAEAEIEVVELGVVFSDLGGVGRKVRVSEVVVVVRPFCADRWVFLVVDLSLCCVAQAFVCFLGLWSRYRN